MRAATLLLFVGSAAAGTEGPVPPPPTASPTTTTDPTCALGILAARGTVCCPSSCGSCGGNGCALRQGGAAACCISGVRSGGRKCDTTVAPCTLDVPGGTGFPSSGFPSRSPQPPTGFPSRFPRPPTGWPVRTGFPRTGFPSSGFPTQSTGYPGFTGYPSTGFPSTGFPRSGFPSTGFPSSSVSAGTWVKSSAAQRCARGNCALQLFSLTVSRPPGMGPIAGSVEECQRMCLLQWAEGCRHINFNPSSTWCQLLRPGCSIDATCADGEYWTYATATGAPTVGTDAPSVGADAPTVGTDAPSVGTDAPTVGTDAPSIGTGAPTVGTDAPSVGTGAPTVGTDAPSVGTGAPSVGTGAPSVGTAAPSVGTGAPTAATGAPGTSPTFAPVSSFPSRAPDGTHSPSTIASAAAPVELSTVSSTIAALVGQPLPGLPASISDLTVSSFTGPTQDSSGDITFSMSLQGSASSLTASELLALHQALADLLGVELWRIPEDLLIVDPGSIIVSATLLNPPYPPRPTKCAFEEHKRHRLNTCVGGGGITCNRFYEDWKAAMHACCKSLECGGITANRRNGRMVWELRVGPTPISSDIFYEHSFVKGDPPGCVHRAVLRDAIFSRGPLDDMHAASNCIDQHANELSSGFQPAPPCASQPGRGVWFRAEIINPFRPVCRVRITPRQDGHWARLGLHQIWVGFHDYAPEWPNRMCSEMTWDQTGAAGRAPFDHVTTVLGCFGRFVFLYKPGQPDEILNFNEIEVFTVGPTPSPTLSPTGPTLSPTTSPTGGPTPSPTLSPTGGPTPSPTLSPTGTGATEEFRLIHQLRTCADGNCAAQAETLRLPAQPQPGIPLEGCQALCRESEGCRFINYFSQVGLCELLLPGCVLDDTCLPFGEYWGLESPVPELDLGAVLDRLVLLPGQPLVPLRSELIVSGHSNPTQDVLGVVTFSIFLLQELGVVDDLIAPELDSLREALGTLFGLHPNKVLVEQTDNLISFLIVEVRLLLQPPPPGTTAPASAA